MQHGHLPRLGRFLMCAQPLGERRAEVESDLLELFEVRAAARGRRYASSRYCLDALSLWRMWSLLGVRAMLLSAIPRRSWVAGSAADVVFAARLFRREPALFSLTVAGVALAIGIATSVFSVLDAVINRGFGVPEPETVYRLRLAHGPSSQGGPWIHNDYLRLRDARQSLPIAAALNNSSRLTFGEVASDAGQPRYVTVGAVSGTFFDLMGGRASLGRTLVEEDNRSGAAPAIVLSDRFWRTEFGGDRRIIGQTIRLHGESFTVVGVASRGFTATDTNQIPVAWMSLAAFSDLQKVRLGAEFDGRFLTVDVFGKRGLGASESRVMTEATAVAAAIADERGLTASDARPRAVTSALTNAESEQFAAFAVSVVMGIVGLLIVLASANVANLLLASAAGRSREIGMRLTLGASRLRIVRQLLTESLLLGVVGGVAGLVLAFWAAPLLGRLLRLPEMLDVTPGSRVLGFSVIVTIAVGLVAGLAPVCYGRRGALLLSINAETPGATSVRTGRMRSFLVGSQAAASIVLLVVAALLTRALVEVFRFDVGLNTSQLVQVSANFRRSYTDAGVRTYLGAAQERLRHMPGVSSVSLSLLGPFEGGYARMSVGPQTGRSVRGYLRGEPAAEVLRHETSHDYFETISARVVRGRTYTADEARNTASVAVISESLAKQFWPNEDPIGSSLIRVWGEEIPANGRAMGFLRKPVGTRVIGVVSDTITRLRSHASPSLYLPMDPLNARGSRIIVRTSGDPQGMMVAIRDAVKSADPNVSIRAAFVSDGLQEQMREPKAFALIAGVFGVSTLLLAVLGLFGVTSFVVRQRRREISVRLALGASGEDVVRLLLWESLRPVVIGMVGGLFLALLGGHVIRGMLYGVSGHDPIAVSSAVLVLLAAATAAVLGPALRALRIDPAEMLKQS